MLMWTAIIFVLFHSESQGRDFLVGSVRKDNPINFHKNEKNGRAVSELPSICDFWAKFTRVLTSAHLICFSVLQMDLFISSSLAAVGLQLQVDENALKAHLNSLGVDEPSFVSHLTEDDLAKTMKIIHARILLAYWKPKPTVTQSLAVPHLPALPPLPVMTEPVDATSTVTGSPGFVIARPQVSLSMSPSGRLALPFRIPLHSIPDNVKLALRNGESLQVGQRTQILEAIYEDVTKHTL